MTEIHCDSSSDLESSDVLEGTPVKEDYNKTLIMGLASKKIQPHVAALSECEESPLRKKDEEGSLNHSTPVYIENESKSCATAKECHSQKKGKKLGMLRSSRSLQAHVSSDEESDEFTPDGRLRHRRYAVESPDSETSQSRGGTLLDTPEEPLCSLKLTSKKCKNRQRWNVLLSDSEGSVTEEAEGLVVSDSPELLKTVPADCSDKKKKCTLDASDSDASDIPEKSATAGKYRDRKLIESSDSETSDALLKTVEDDDNDSTVQLKEVSSSFILNLALVSIYFIQM
jgi:hypothetical protein